MNVESVEGGLPIPERLQRLQAYEKSWRTLRWANRETLQKFYSVWELSGQHIAQGLCRNYGEHDGSSTRLFFDFHRLPGVSRGTPGGHWRHYYGSGEFDVQVRDFIMDPNQDLLILAS